MCLSRNFFDSALTWFRFLKVADCQSILSKRLLKLSIWAFLQGSLKGIKTSSTPKFKQNRLSLPNVRGWYRLPLKDASLSSCKYWGMPNSFQSSIRKCIMLSAPLFWYCSKLAWDVWTSIRFTDIIIPNPLIYRGVTKSSWCRYPGCLALICGKYFLADFFFAPPTCLAMRSFRFKTRLIVERAGLFRYPKLSSSWWMATAPQKAYFVSGVSLLVNFILLLTIACSSSLPILPGLLWGALDWLRYQSDFSDCARLSHLYTQSRVRLSSLWIWVTFFPSLLNWTQSLRSLISASLFWYFF